jgi:carbamoyltransferase
LIFTIDAMGDALSVTVSIGKGTEIKRLYAQTGFSAISTYYTRLTEFLGFQPVRHEGKITSLAGYGKPQPALMALAQEALAFVPAKEGFNFKNHFVKESVNDAFHRKLKNYTREDIAYSFQENFEVATTKFVEFWVNKLNIAHVVLAGGAAANVSLNACINRIPGIKSLYIFPHMGDGGLALGAALGFLRPRPFYLKNIYLGSRYDDRYIRDILKKSGFQFSFLDEPPMCEKIARLIFEGKVVAHFNAHMEYGPRALGNRSILYRADDPSCQGWLNDWLKRSHFMPFAPMTLDSEADSLYIDIETIRYTLRFMNVAVECTNAMKQMSPGAVHIDGTARPQIVYKEDNPRIYKVLQIYQRLKKTATFLNTSFNRHEEPIVCSPDDAIKSFHECELDYLVLNNFLVSKNSVPR